MNKVLKVDSFEVIGLNAHHVLVEKGKNIQEVMINNKAYKVAFERTLTLDSTIKNRIGFSDKIAIDSIEKNGSYGFATKVEITIRQ